MKQMRFDVWLKCALFDNGPVWPNKTLGFFLLGYTDILCIQARLEDWLKCALFDNGPVWPNKTLRFFLLGYMDILCIQGPQFCTDTENTIQYLACLSPFLSVKD